MGHILTVTLKIAGFSLLGLLLTATAAVVLFQLSGTYKAHALNVRVEVRADPAGIVQVVNRTGDLPPGIINSAGNAFTAPTTDLSAGDSGTEPAGDNEEGEPEPAPPGETESTPPSEPAPASASVKSPPPGIEKQIKGGGGVPPGLLSPRGSRPTTLTINTDISFGTVFPGETHEDYFIIYLTDSEILDSPTTVLYHLILSTPGGSENLTPYLTVVRDPDETDAIADNVTSARLDDPGDTSDKWLVTLNLPDALTEGDYGTTIVVWVDYPLP